jgi:hypothetical protein
MSKRGEIRNREMGIQIRDYSGLRWEKITPTDIDGFLDFGGRLFIIIELKYEDADMPNGQKLALERICDACQKGGAESYILIGSHSNATGDIDGANATVIECYYKGRWMNVMIPCGMKYAINKLREKHRIGVADKINH